MCTWLLPERQPRAPKSTMRFRRTVTLLVEPALTSIVVFAISYSKPLVTSMVNEPTGAWVV